MQLITPVALHIIAPLTVIINPFIKNENIPGTWKIARIITISKIRTPEQLSDYRLISVLPVLSKIHKKLVLKQTVEFIENHKLYKPTQCF